MYVIIAAVLGFGVGVFCPAVAREVKNHLDMCRSDWRAACIDRDRLKEQLAETRLHFGVPVPYQPTAADIEAESPARFGTANLRVLTNDELSARVRRLELWVAEDVGDYAIRRDIHTDVKAGK